MSKCPHCGGEIKFSAKDQKVHCQYCNSDFEVEELVQKTSTAKKKIDRIKGKSYLCSQCGATLLSFDETAVTFCSYCGSQNVLEDKLIVQTAPDFIIPFSKTKEECIDNYKNKVQHALFCPNYMKSDLVIKRFRGIYMPYGIYNLYFSGDCVNKGSKYAYNDGKDSYYYQYDLHSNVESTCEGISFDLLSKFYDDQSQIIPFNYKEAKPFNSNYLSGFYVDRKDIDESVYNDLAKKMGEKISRKYLCEDPTYGSYNCINPKVPYQIKETKTGLCPVYFVAVKDKDNKHLHYAIINGQTGKVVADLPVDFKKYLLFSVLLAIPLFFLVNSLGIIFPTIVCGFSLLSSIFGIMIFLKQLVLCNQKENKEYDIGYHSLIKEETNNVKKSNKTKESIGITLLASFAIISMLILTGVLIVSGSEFLKMNGLVNVRFISLLPMLIIPLWFGLFASIANTKMKIQPDFKIFNKGFLYKIIPSVILPTITLILNPINDYYYYISSIISFSLIILSFYDLVKLQNRLASRPIPQLDQRGGDENE